MSDPHAINEVYYTDLGPSTEWRFADPVRERAWRRHKVAEAADGDAVTPDRPLTDEEFAAANVEYVASLGEGRQSPFWR